MAFSAQTVGHKPLNEFLPPDVHFWGPIYGLFFRPDSGTEALEKFPGTQCAFLGAPALAVSAQIVGHISLTFFKDPRLVLLGENLEL